MDSIIIEPLGEAFGQNLETVNVNSSRQTQISTSEGIPIFLNKSYSNGELPTVYSPSSSIASHVESQDDPSSVSIGMKPDESMARTRLLNMVNKEGQDVLENMETIVVKNVEQGKCAAFKKIENSNEKRSVNEPKYTQVSRLVDNKSYPAMNEDLKRIYTSVSSYWTLDRPIWSRHA